MYFFICNILKQRLGVFPNSHYLLQFNPIKLEKSIRIFHFFLSLFHLHSAALFPLPLEDIKREEFLPLPADVVKQK